MLEGWVKLHRSITEWEWYKDINTFKVFLHLLLTANHSARKWQGIDVKEGQKITSISHISNECGLSFQKTRTALNKLKSTGEITIKSTNKYTLITIEKWRMYQSNGFDLTSQLTSNTTNNQQSNNKQITTNNNDKNVENDKKINKYSHLEADISEIRKLYQGNKNKAVAYKKLPKLIEKYGKEQLIRCIERYNRYVQDTRANGFATLQYKNEGTFWNGGYMDYLDENVSQTIISQNKEEVEHEIRRMPREILERVAREEEELPY